MSLILTEDFEVPTHLLEVGEIIEYELDNFCLDKRSKHYKEWKVKLNELIDKYNSMANFPAYSKIK